MKSIAIVGSRKYPRLGRVRDWIRDHVGLDDTVISGHAEGVDKAAEEMALSLQIAVYIIPAQWRRFPGGSAGYIRNARMIKLADEVVAWWDEASRGTAHNISLARQHQKPLTTYGKDGQVIARERYDNDLML